MGSSPEASVNRRSPPIGDANCEYEKPARFVRRFTSAGKPGESTQPSKIFLLVATYNFAALGTKDSQPGHGLQGTILKPNLNAIFGGALRNFYMLVGVSKDQLREK